MNPPFRADQVGSLLRPERLKQARVQFLGPQTPTSAIGPHEHLGLRAVEDECVREAVAMQERIGLKAVTDGEFRRRSWWLELILGWEGFEADRTGSAKLKWRDASGPFGRELPDHWLTFREAAVIFDMIMRLKGFHAILGPYWFDCHACRTE